MGQILNIDLPDLPSGASQRNVRLVRALWSVQGLSLGDSFGEKFFVNPASSRDLSKHMRYQQLLGITRMTL